LWWGKTKCDAGLLSEDEFELSKGKSEEPPEEYDSRHASSDEEPEPHLTAKKD
jgi:hypothetical protein